MNEIFMEKFVSSVFFKWKRAFLKQPNVVSAQIWTEKRRREFFLKFLSKVKSRFLLEKIWKSGRNFLQLFGRLFRWSSSFVRWFIGEWTPSASFQPFVANSFIPEPFEFQWFSAKCKWNSASFVKHQQTICVSSRFTFDSHCSLSLLIWTVNQIHVLDSIQRLIFNKEIRSCDRLRWRSNRYLLVFANLSHEEQRTFSFRSGEARRRRSVGRRGSESEMSGDGWNRLIFFFTKSKLISSFRFFWSSSKRSGIK